MPAKKRHPKITSFDLVPGRRIGRQYAVVQLLGKGVEGEVYQIVEKDTGIHRAAKIYFPHRDPSNRSTVWHARKLNKLRHCPIVLQYHHTEIIQVKRAEVRCLVSDFAEGMQLERWIEDRKGKRLQTFEALHVLWHLVRGLEAVHAMGEYHSDVHSQNILIRQSGVGFDLKLVDFYDWGRPAKYKQQQDVINCIEVFRECLGGTKCYAAQPQIVKRIIKGMQRRLLIKQFPTMTALRQHLESFDWD